MAGSGRGHTHEDAIKSHPPAGKKEITNIYWDPDSEEIVVEHD